MKYQLTALRMAISKKATNNKHWQGCGESKSPCTAGGNWYGHYGKIMKFSQKIKNITTIWSSNSTPGYLYKQKEKH